MLSPSTTDRGDSAGICAEHAILGPPAPRSDASHSANAILAPAGQANELQHDVLPVVWQEEEEEEEEFEQPEQQGRAAVVHAACTLRPCHQLRETKLE